MVPEKFPEILLVSLNRRPPTWLHDKKVIGNYRWSAYLKPFSGGFPSIEPKSEEHKKEVLLLDTGHSKNRDAHCGDGVLPDWFIHPFLHEILGEKREQRFPFVVLYDSNGDPNLPDELKSYGLHSFFCLSRNNSRWSTKKDLSNSVNFVWNKWNKKHNIPAVKQLDNERHKTIVLVSEIALEINYQYGYSMFEKKLKEKNLRQDRARLATLYTRLKENQDRESLCGYSDAIKNERAEIIQSLNELALKVLDKTFTDLCSKMSHKGET